MADPKKVKARVLVGGVFGEPNDVVEVDQSEVKANQGVLDAEPAAVEYAESLAK